MTEENGSSYEITSDDKLWAALAYIFSPIIPIIILLLEDKKERPYIKTHNVQALVLGAAALVINILLSFIFVGICTSVLTFILMIYYGVKAYKGEVFEIPVITKFVKDQGWA